VEPMKSQEKPYGIIYKVTCKITNMHYIGQTIQTLRGRKCGHKSAAKNNCKGLLSDEIRKYGWQNFIWETICFCKNQQELNENEIKNIIFYNSLYPNGYNKYFGSCGAGYKHSEESRRKMSEARKGKNNPMYGKHFKHTDEAKIAIGISSHIRHSNGNHPMYGKYRKKSSCDATAAGLRHRWLITDKDGKNFIVDNMKKFCSENGLNYIVMVDVVQKGTQKYHKGYKCKKLQKVSYYDTSSKIKE